MTWNWLIAGLGYFAMGCLWAGLLRRVKKNEITTAGAGLAVLAWPVGVAWLVLQIAWILVRLTLYGIGSLALLLTGTGGSKSTPKKPQY